MNTPANILSAVFLAVVLAISVTGIAGESRLQPHELIQQPDSLHPLMIAVNAYRKAVADGDSIRQRALLSSNARRWFESTVGEGIPVRPGRPGPWHEWDKFFNASSFVERVRIHGDSVLMTIIETNDFYRLIDRKPSPTSVTYFFDANGRIAGILVARSVKPNDRFDEFKNWAQENRPAEIMYLMPEGEIVPDMPRARRWRTILTEWRQIVGLPSVE